MYDANEYSLILKAWSENANSGSSEHFEGNFERENPSGTFFILNIFSHVAQSFKISVVYSFLSSLNTVPLHACFKTVSIVYLRTIFGPCEHAAVPYLHSSGNCLDTSPVHCLSIIYILMLTHQESREQPPPPPTRGTYRVAILLSSLAWGFR